MGEQILCFIILSFFFCKQRLTLFQKLNVLKVRSVYKTSIITGQCFFSLGNFTRLIRITKFMIGRAQEVCLQKNFFSSINSFI